MVALDAYICRISCRAFILMAQVRNLVYSSRDSFLANLTSSPKEIRRRCGFESHPQHHAKFLAADYLDRTSVEDFRPTQLIPASVGSLISSGLQYWYKDPFERCEPFPRLPTTLVTIVDATKFDKILSAGGGGRTHEAYASDFSQKALQQNH